MASTCSLPLLGSKEERGDVWNLVVKVNYGDTLRRFNAHVHQQFMFMEYDMNKLKAKISSIFKFTPDAVLVLTYTDEDGDVVTLDNDDELCDAVICQRLNPLRINVQLKSFSTDGSYSGPTTVKNSDCNSDCGPDEANQALNGFPKPATELSSTVEKSLKSVLEPIHGTLENILYDLIQTASSTPMLGELLLLLSKMQLTNISQSSHEPTDNPLGVSCQTPILVNSNTDDEPKITNDPHNQLPTVLPQTNFVSPIPVDIQKILEVGCLKEYVGSKERKESCDVNHDGESMVAAKLPSMSATTQCGKNTLESFDKPNPNIAPVFLHGNSNNNMLPYDATSQRPFDLMFSFKQGGSTSHVDVLGSKPFASPTAFPSHSPVLHPHKKSSSFLGSMPHHFHRGIICDGCGMHPIVGPRYKSTVFEDYDLCSTCFIDIGNEAEYMRIDWSAVQFSKAMKDHQKLQYSNQLHSALASHDRMKAPIPKLNGCLIRDLTVCDGTVMSPCSCFTKIWKMRNNGTISWPFGTQLMRVRGDYLGGQDSAKLKIPETGFPVDEELDIAVDCFSPSVSGQYMSYWQLVSPFGQKFGEEVWVIIQVDYHQSASSAFLNLNLSPKSSHQNYKIIIDVNAEPLDSNKLSMAPEMFNSTQQDGTSVLPSSSQIPNPCIDIMESLPLVSYPLIDIPYRTNPPCDALAEEDLVEQTLLRELEEMGFKQIDLNKEILRQNQYDLEQSLEDLFGFVE